MEDMALVVQVPLRSKNIVEIIGKRGVYISDLSSLPISLGYIKVDEQAKLLIKF